MDAYLIHTAALLWNANNNTLDIARVIKCDESEVYASIESVKEEAREIRGMAERKNTERKNAL